MEVKVFSLLFLLTLFSFTFVSAGNNFAYNKNSPQGNVTNLYNNTNITTNNYDITMGVNQTQMENVTIINIKESWFTSLWNSLFRNWHNQNLNTTADVKFNTINVTGNYFYNGSSRFSFEELNTSGGGGNLSFNQSFADGVYISASDPTKGDMIYSLGGDTAIDYMEYTTDTNAQNVYVTNALSSYTSDVTATMTSNETPSPNKVWADGNQVNSQGWNAFDGNNGFPQGWYGYPFGNKANITYDFGSGVTKIITMYNLSCGHTSQPTLYLPTAWTFEGSNDNSTWTVLDSKTGQSLTAGVFKDYSFTNTNAYRYYKFSVTAVSGDSPIVREMEMYESVPIALSVKTSTAIKTQGSYALNISALQTTSLGKTINHTITPLNLSGIDTMKIDIRASRTGSNFNMSFTDSGGGIITFNVTINSANTWETKTLDISGVSDVNKDAINLFNLTITNADADNVIYLDNLFYQVLISGWDKLAIGSVGQILTITNGLPIWSNSFGLLFSNSTNVGIGTTSPIYPLVVATNSTQATNSISAWFSGNISATGFITRTSIFENTNKSAFDYIKDASYYKDLFGNIDHTKFYGYVDLGNVPDYEHPIITNSKNCLKEHCVNINVTTYNMIHEEGVDLEKEVSVLRQALYEQKLINQQYKLALCEIKPTLELCK